MNEKEKYEQIQHYLDASLSETERLAFEQELTKDPGLQAALDLHLLSNDAIEFVIEDSLRSELQTLHQKSTITRKTANSGRVVNLRRRIIPLSIAATVLLLVGFFTANFQGKQYDNQAIAGAFYENDLLLRVRGSNSASLLQEGMQLFSQEDYPAAIDYFEQVSDPTLQAEANYAAAHAHYNLEQYPVAMQNFAAVIDSQDPRFTEKAELYYLLSTLAADQTTEQRFGDLLTKMIENKEHLHHQEALAINKKLNSFWRNF
jgi:tetratricopeptide (TPR) repeat protein